MGKFIPRTPQQKEWVRIADKFILERLPPDSFEDGAKFRGRMRSLIQRHVEKTGLYHDYGAVLFICAHFWINHFKRDWESYKITRSEPTKMSLETLEKWNLVTQENPDLVLSGDQKDRLLGSYIIAIQNEITWYYNAKMAVNQNNFGKFRRLCDIEINHLSNENNENLSSMECAYIGFELWLSLGGKPEQCLTDPGTLSQQYAYLVDNANANAKSTDLMDIAKTTISTIDQMFFYADAISILEHPANLYTISQKEHTMNTITTNPSAAIETKIVIFGQDAETMTEQQLIDAIKRVEGDIAKLKEVKTKSKKIAANIYDLETQLNAIVAVLDER